MRGGTIGKSGEQKIVLKQIDTKDASDCRATMVNDPYNQGREEGALNWACTIQGGAL